MEGVLNSSAESVALPAISHTANVRGGARSRKKGRRISFVLSRPSFMRGDAWFPDASVFGAFDVRAVFGHHHDPGSGADMRRHRGTHTVGEHGGLIGRGRGLAFGHRLG